MLINYRKLTCALLSALTMGACSNNIETSNMKECSPLLKEALAKKDKAEFSAEQMSEIISECIALGDDAVATVKGAKSAIAILGNTGAGKSTLINWLCGCTMYKHFNQTEGKYVISVLPSSEGGVRDSMAEIGHTKESMTFIPNIIRGPGDLLFIDCPGLMDNRGPAINIANIINTKRVLQAVEGLGVIMLINYHSLEADRAKGVTEMAKILCTFFGSKELLMGSIQSLLLGISNLSASTTGDFEDFDDVKLYLRGFKGNTSLVSELSPNAFIYDPLNEPLEGGLNRDELFERISSLVLIKSNKDLFQVALSNSDKLALQSVVDDTYLFIQNALGKKNSAKLPEPKAFVKAAEALCKFSKLRVIGHADVSKFFIKLADLVNIKLVALSKEIEVQYIQENFEFGDELFDSLKTFDCLLSQMFDEANEEDAKILDQILRDISPKQLARCKNECSKSLQERKDKEERDEETRRKLEENNEKTLKMMEKQQDRAYEQQQRQAALQEEMIRGQAKHSADIIKMTTEMNEKVLAAQAKDKKEQREHEERMAEEGKEKFDAFTRQLAAQDNARKDKELIELEKLKEANRHNEAIVKSQKSSSLLGIVVSALNPFSS